LDLRTLTGVTVVVFDWVEGTAVVDEFCTWALEVEDAPDN
tara:strand:- start:503 stop:622 length:120 start_codon:yes stop_codon:yes gene_type:complete